MITNQPSDKLTVQHMKLARIPERYWKARVEDFPDDYGGLDYVHTYLEKLIPNMNDGVGMLFFGEPGHGKTHLAIGVLKKALAHNATGLFLEASSIQDVTIQREQLDFVSMPVAKAAETVDMLVLDDVGAEHTSDFSRVLVEKLIRHRGTRNKSTIITMNLKLNLLGETYGEAFASAIREYVFPIKIQGKDWREDRVKELERRFGV
jgi:DNA replication protein DnaC